MTKVLSVKRPADASRTAAQWMALGGIFGPLLRDLTLLVASLATAVLAVLLYLTFAPTSPLAAAHVGGLSERLFMLETQAWFIAFGYRLFKTDKSAAIPST